MLSVSVGLVDTTGKVDPKYVAAVAAALNTQISRDVPQFWSVHATVSYLPSRNSIPQGCWPIFLVPSLPPGEGGFHMTAHNQPYAKVIATLEDNDWSIDASHEMIEMLIDPNGNRLQTSTAIEIEDGKIVDGVGQFEYLVEACDPCEANQYAYPIDGISVSDFLTPHFYDPTASSGVKYSFTGALQRPREILPGGYISWVNPEKDVMQQILWVNPGEPPILKTLGPANGASLREFVENNTHGLMREKRQPLSAGVAKLRKSHREAILKFAEIRAGRYK